MKTFIHVNTQAIQKNFQLPPDSIHEPVFVVRSEYDAHLKDANLLTKREIRFAHSVEIDGPSTLVYNPENPLYGGARAWIETESPVTLK